MGLRTCPAPLVITCARHRQPERVEGGWRMEEEDTGAGGWSTAAPHIVAIVGREDEV